MTPQVAPQPVLQRPRLWSGVRNSSANDSQIVRAILCLSSTWGCRNARKSMPDNVSALGYWLAMLDYKGAKGVGLKAQERRELSSCGPDRRRGLLVAPLIPAKTACPIHAPEVDATGE